MNKAEYDFLTWTSFPSSLKLSTDEFDYFQPLADKLPITVGKRVKAIFQAKQENVTKYNSHIGLRVWNGTEYIILTAGAKEPIDLPYGTFGWTKFTSYDSPIPDWAQWLKIDFVVGGGDPIGINWIDDLKIYQDDALIYENKFSNWAPVIIPAEIITGVAIIKYLK